MSGIPNKMLPVAVEMLPEGYRRLEYLESTGTQWIRTEIKLSNESEVRCEYMATNGEFATNQALYGYFVVPRFSGYGLHTDSHGCRYIAYIGQDGSSCDFPISVGQKNTLVHNGKSITFNGQTLNFSDTTVFEQTGSCFLFTAHEMYGCFRVYSFSIFRNDQLQLNFIPCLDDKGKPCMFDTVSRKPFYNKGTGEFLYRLPGDGELPAGYTRLEYLESTGTQHIDTGVKLSSESEVQCEFEQTSSNDAYIALYGSRNTYLQDGYVWNISTPQAGTGQIEYGNSAVVRYGTEQGVVSVTKNKEQNYQNDVQLTANVANEFESPISCFLYAVNIAAKPSYNATARVYSFSISRNDQLQLNFIPCLDDKGVPCMFDTVTRRPFRNAATTGPDFLYG